MFVLTLGFSRTIKYCVQRRYVRTHYGRLVYETEDILSGETRKLSMILLRAAIENFTTDVALRQHPIHCGDVVLRISPIIRREFHELRSKPQQRHPEIKLRRSGSFGRLSQSFPTPYVHFRDKRTHALSDFMPVGALVSASE